MSNEGPANPQGVSPASSGPADPHFEAQVGASYLLAMLTGGEPRGLPGMVIDRIELTSAGTGWRMEAYLDRGRPRSCVAPDRVDGCVTRPGGTA